MFRFTTFLFLLVLSVCARGEEAQVIGFTASWCPNCPKMKPEWNKIGIKAYDIDLYPNEAAKWRVSAVPTTLVVSGGRELRRFNGFADSNDILSVVREVTQPVRAAPPESRSNAQENIRGLVGSVEGKLRISLAGAAKKPPVRLINETAEDAIRGMLPTTDNETINSLLSSHDLIWYAEEVMPMAYQFQNTLHDPHFNIAAKIENDKFGNGNMEFPWRVTGGCENVKNLQAYKFLRLPQKDDGTYWPMVMFDAQYPGNQTGEARGAISQHQWMYPKGTVFGELMCMTHGEYVVPFELRLRFRESTYWEVDTYRPFPTAYKLSQKIKELKPEWETTPDLASLVRHLDGRERIVLTQFGDTNKTRQAFTATTGIDTIPPIKDDELVMELLTQSDWSSAAGETWKTNNGVDSFAPTVAKGSGFHIVPEDYGGHAFAVDSVSCMKCHEHTGISVRNFTQNRGWYGRIRGSDGVISFHPYDPGCISASPAAIKAHPDKRMGDNLSIVYRPEFVSAGIVMDYNKDFCPERMYQRITTLGVR